MDKRQATREVADLYSRILEEKLCSYPTKPGELSHSHLRWMCKTISKNAYDWDLNKSSRWIGYVQGVLTALQVVSVQEHRDWTRELFS